MNRYNYNSTVSSQEAEALKEMIFKRARERAQALTDDVQTSYKQAVQNDIMDIARDCFAKERNPFSFEKTLDVAEQATGAEKEENVEKEERAEIGFAKCAVNDIKSQIQVRNENETAQIASAQVNSAMLASRENFAKKASFMGALNFLNSQASISLIKSKGKSFEAIA